MIITDEFIKSLKPLQGDYDYWLKVNKPDLAEFMCHAVKDDHLDCANWLFCYAVPHKKAVKYAIHAAEMVLPIYEKQYPEDDRPRIAIEAAKNNLLTAEAADALFKKAEQVKQAVQQALGKSEYLAEELAEDAAWAWAAYRAAEATYFAVRAVYKIYRAAKAAESAYWAAHTAYSPWSAYCAAEAEEAEYLAAEAVWALFRAAQSADLAEEAAHKADGKIHMHKALQIQLIEHAISLIDTEETI